MFDQEVITAIILGFFPFFNYTSIIDFLLLLIVKFSYV